MEALTLTRVFTMSFPLQLFSIAHEPPQSLRILDVICRKRPARSMSLAVRKSATTSEAPQSEEDWEVDKQTICGSSTAADFMTRKESKHGFKDTFEFITGNDLKVSLIVEGGINT